MFDVRLECDTTEDGVELLEAYNQPLPYGDLKEIYKELDCEEATPSVMKMDIKIMCFQIWKY